FFKGIANTRALGRVDIFIDTDFRGGAESSYTPRLRNAYVSFMGITAGRAVTTFSDPMAAPRTIDFQGPNAYCFNYATLIRYQRSWADDHLTAAIALEQPNVSGTYGTTFEEIPQRVPDIPIYLQYQWGENRDSHLRMSGIFRDMYAYSVTSDKNTTQVGWGVQLSGRAKLCHWMKLIYSGTLGEGITPYIQDLIGSGLDFTPKSDDGAELQATPMYAWQAAAEFNISSRVSATGGYSAVNVDTKYGYYSDDEYKMGQYIFGNVFYAVTPRMQIACEYIYGNRKNMDQTKNSANRASVMVQYHF
ncbi:MAG: DcaP family trimeric outer membrane transporter, partial [Rikenellaceae bacterium]